MRVFFIDNIKSKLVEVLKTSLPSAQQVKFGVAFVKQSGFSLIEEEFKKCLENGGKIELLIGLDFRITDPQVLQTLYELSKGSQGLLLFCCRTSLIEEVPTFHPKIYFFLLPEKARIVVGSSNLTKGGLLENVEANLMMEGNSDEPIVREIGGFFETLKIEYNLFTPDREYIEKYASIFKDISRKGKQIVRRERIRKKFEELEEKEQKLPKPEKLTGWLGLVYERLPIGTFSVEDVYAYKNDFRKAYPDNRHIRAKIRQVLQRLRDMGLIKHVDRGKWAREK